jgi:hypothetical protein
MLVMIKTADPTAAFSETERDELAERPEIPAPRMLEVDAMSLAEARAAVQLEPGEQIAWIVRNS